MILKEHDELLGHPCTSVGMAVKLLNIMKSIFS